MNFVSSAHFVVGVVNDSINGIFADGKTVILWKPSLGMSDNVSDIIGPSGNSGSNNVYLIDCELLSSPCEVNDIISLKVIDFGEGYTSNTVNVSITGAGFDVAGELILNSPPYFLNLTLDDNINLPLNELDLNPGGFREVFCSAFLLDYENDSIIKANATFFDSIVSSRFDNDDNNRHYSNSSCLINQSYAENITYVECGINVAYYANSNTWNCTLQIFGNEYLPRQESNITFINTLLAISLPESIDYGVVSSLRVSNESVINVSNYGNTRLNLSLEGYAVHRFDNLSMNCTEGLTKNISISYQKYNLTSSNTSVLSLSEFEFHYSNLTSNPIVKRFNLNYRQNDLLNDAINSTYWRIYVPSGVAGSCSGNLIFGARTAPGN